MPLPRQPRLTVDLIVSFEEGVVLVERRFEPFGWAIPGGFVEWGETLEQAVVREAKEETGLDVTDVRQFHAYSDPARDPRGHTVTVVFTGTGHGRLQAGDDAKDARVFRRDALPQLVCDHREVLEDWFAGRYP
jgi:ADP-ribose pyrophosphatase YjhB (NUDIX family)